MLMALVIVAVADAQPNEQSSTFLVRIIARQLEDGRIEFGLRAGANEHLPADHFVEPDVAHRGWLSSSIVPLGDTKGVRLIARRLAGGWTEFGLRVEGLGTEHLPRARFFPARVDHGRWLVSNRFALELPLASPAPVIHRGPEPPCLHAGLDGVPETAIIDDQLDLTCRSLRWPASPARYFPLTLDVQTHIRISVSSDLVNPVVYIAPADRLPYYDPLAVHEPEDGADVYITTLLQPGTYLIEVATATSEQDPFRLTFSSRPMPYGKISAGHYHTCLLTDGGAIECWGRNTDAEGADLGQANPPSGAFTQVSAGAWHTCGLRPDGLIECWGSDQYGESTPPPDHFVQVAAGMGHTCGLTTDGSVLCRGFNDRGQLDVPDLADATITSVTAGRYMSCALTTGGVARCWGAGRADWRSSPPGYVQIDGGFFGVCGLRRLQHFCFDPGGGSGRGHGGDPHVEISAGSFAFCTVRDSGAVTCQTEGWSAEPIEWEAITPQGQFLRVTVGSRHACALTMDGKVVCWGDNEHGQTDVPQHLR